MDIKVCLAARCLEDVVPPITQNMFNIVLPVLDYKSEGPVATQSCRGKWFVSPQATFGKT